LSVKVSQSLCQGTEGEKMAGLVFTEKLKEEK